MESEAINQMKVTCSTSFAHQSLKWKNVKAHNDRTPKERSKNGKSIKRSNQSIDPKYTKYNRYGTLQNYYDFMNTPAVEEQLSNRNLKNIKSRHYKNCFIKKSNITKLLSKTGNLKADNINNRRLLLHLKRNPSFVCFVYDKGNGHVYKVTNDLHKYLKSKNYSNTRCGVITLGNTAFRNKIETASRKRGLTTGQCRQEEADELLRYMKNFNRRHHHIKIGGFAIHCDETFIHAHAQFMTLTTTKSGKPSFSFSKGIHDEFPAHNNKASMKRYRNVEDNILVNQFSNGKLKLYRRHNQTKESRQQHSLVASYASHADSLKASIKNKAVSEAQPVIQKDFSSASNSVASASAFNSATANSLSSMKITTREQYKQATRANNEAHRLKTEAMDKLKKAYKAYSDKLDAKYDKMKRDIITLKTRYIQPLANRFNSSSIGKKWQNVNPFSHRRARNVTTTSSSHLTRRQQAIRRNRKRGPQI